MSVRVEYFQNTFVSVRVLEHATCYMRLKFEHVRGRSVFVCLPTLKNERNKGCINSFVVKGNLET